MVKNILRSSASFGELSKVDILDSVQIFKHFLYEVVLLHSASSLTSTGENTAVLVGKIMKTQSSELDQSHENALVFLMTHIRARNLNVQNFLFMINWNILLTVRIRKY